METFIQIKNFPRYEINSYGIIRVIKSKKIIKLRKYKGYLDVNLSTNGKKFTKSVHRLVAEAFIPNPYNLPFVDHIDRVSINNHQSNLRWVNRVDNNSNRLFITNKPYLIHDNKFLVGCGDKKFSFNSLEEAVLQFKQLI